MKKIIQPLLITITTLFTFPIIQKGASFEFPKITNTKHPNDRQQKQSFHTRKSSCSSSSSSSSSSFSSSTITTTSTANVPPPPSSSHERIKITSSIAKSERRHNERLSSQHAREICPNCKRPTSICLCDSLPSHKFWTNTRVLILQHPTEFKRKTISTVPLIPLVLENCKVKVGYQFGGGNNDNNDNLEELMKLDWMKECIVKRKKKPLLLFPGEDSLDLKEFLVDHFDTTNANQNRPPQDDDCDFNHKDEKDGYDESTPFELLILIDGTWSQAKRTARESPALINLCQKVQFTALGNSIYDAIRREPEDHYLSTLECCAQALLELEPKLVKPSQKEQTEIHFQNEMIKSNMKNDDMNGDLHNATKAHYYLNKALSSLVNQQLQIRSQPGSSPRFVDPKSKFQEKHKQRRLEIEQDLFQSQTTFNPSLQQPMEMNLTNDLINTTTIPMRDSSQLSFTNSNPDPKRVRVVRLPDGSTLRPLRHSDAPVLNYHYHYQPDQKTSSQSLKPQHNPKTTSKTLAQISRKIQTNPTTCFGIFRGHEYCGSILQYENGLLGMLYVVPDHRRKGYASMLVKAATEELELLGRESVCYILDGNEASEKVFTNMGWRKADPAGKKGTGRRRAPRMWIKDGMSEDGELERSISKL